MLLLFLIFPQADLDAEPSEGSTAKAPLRSHGQGHHSSGNGPLASSPGRLSTSQQSTQAAAARAVRAIGVHYPQALEALAQEPMVRTPCVPPA